MPSVSGGIAPPFKDYAADSAGAPGGRAGGQMKSW